MDEQLPLFRSSATTFRYAGWLTLGTLLTCGVPVVACVESAALGPYTTWYNQSKLTTALKAGLKGRPASDVEAVLGSADEILNRSESQTFNYYPYPYLPFSKFQVFSVNGVVTGFEMFDD
ncbi:hypothetical protein [Corallococcus exiguus]|uniref:Uncharacterized protein n=1 Tax=Corallococcus exiguus TaxID=83462 RepID=A0A7X4Y945_9BACT|nr:hypothetical protein [Corallococcus exiguus]NBC41195.1 hypothetical protein [Corallococcus exiguus]